jgi:hypothetical protein
MLLSFKMLEKVEGKDAMIMRPRMYRHRTIDTSSKGRTVQGTHCPRDALSKGLVDQGKRKKTV